MSIFPHQLPDDTPIYDMRLQRCVPSVVRLAQNIGLVEYILKHDNTASLEEVAVHYKVPERNAEAILTVMTALGFLEVARAGIFSVSESGSTYLRAESPYFTLVAPEPYPRYEELEKAFFSNAPTGGLATALNTKSTERQHQFIRNMHDMILPAALTLSHHPLFKKTKKLLDVGAGSGTVSAAIVDTHPHIHATLFDIPAVCTIAESYIESFRMKEKLHVHPGDMFLDSWPKDHDTIVLSNIFHDWDTESCAKLAEHAFNALPRGGTVVLHEMPLNEKMDGPLTVSCFSVAMLVKERGKQYTLFELTMFLERAGFTNVSFEHSHHYYYVISAQKTQG